MASEVTRRWETGVAHHPESERIFNALEKIDRDNNDYFDWRAGGDGDNGEELMYLLDIYFDNLDTEFFK